MPKRHRKTGLSKPPSADAAVAPARPARKPRPPWWKDPLRLAGGGFAILMAIELGAGSRLPSTVVNYLDMALFFLGALSIVLGIMRRLEKH